MNTLRLSLLFAILGLTVLMVMSRVAPDVITQETDAALISRAEAEARTVLATERQLLADREIRAREIARDENLLLSLMPRQLVPGSDPSAEPVYRPRPDVGDAFVSAVSGRLNPGDRVVLTDPSGTLLGDMGDSRGISAEEFLEPSQAESANREAVHRMFTIEAGAFATAVVPIRSPDGEVLARVSLIRPLDRQHLQRLWNSSGMTLALFTRQTLVDSTASVEGVHDSIEEVVGMSTDANVGQPGRAVLYTTREFEGQTSEGLADGRRYLIAPFDISGELGIGPPRTLGIVVAVDAPPAPSSLLEYLVTRQAFAEGTVALWAALIAAFGIYVVLLLVNDFVREREIARVATHIDNTLTTNDPASIRDRDVARYLRPIAAAYNRFLDAYKSQKQATLRARDSADEARRYAEEHTREAFVETEGPPTRDVLIADDLDVEPVRADSRPSGLELGASESTVVPSEFDFESPSINRAADEFLRSTAADDFEQMSPLEEPEPLHAAGAGIIEPEADPSERAQEPDPLVEPDNEFEMPAKPRRRITSENLIEMAPDLLEEDEATSSLGEAEPLSPLSSGESGDRPGPELSDPFASDDGWGAIATDLQRRGTIPSGQQPTASAVAAVAGADEVEDSGDPDLNSSIDAMLSSPGIQPDANEVSGLPLPRPGTEHPDQNEITAFPPGAKLEEIIEERFSDPGDDTEEDPEPTPGAFRPAAVAPDASGPFTLESSRGAVRMDHHEGDEERSPFDDDSGLHEGVLDDGEAETHEALLTASVGPAPEAPVDTESSRSPFEQQVLSPSLADPATAKVPLMGRPRTVSGAKKAVAGLAEQKASAAEPPSTSPLSRSTFSPGAVPESDAAPIEEERDQTVETAPAGKIFRRRKAAFTLNTQVEASDADLPRPARASTYFDQDRDIATPSYMRESRKTTSRNTPSVTREPDELLARAEARLRMLRGEQEALVATTPDSQQRLYEAFISARKSCGQPTAGLTLEKFADKLLRNRQAIIDKMGCREVQFKVEVANGRAALKAQPLG